MRETVQIPKRTVTDVQRCRRPGHGHILRTLLPLLLLVAGVTGLRGQEGREVWRIGGLVAGGLAWQTAEMTGLPDVPSCCPGYDGGSGNLLATGFGFELPVSARFSFRANLLYTQESGTLEATEEELVALDRDTAHALFLHTIESTRPSLGFEGLIGYGPIERLRVFGGLRIGLTLSGEFHQEERILEPSTLRYGDGSRVRMAFDGPLAGERPVLLAVMAGVRYDLPLNAAGSWILSPEVALMQGLTDIIEDRSWKAGGIRFGLSLQYALIDRATSTPLEPLQIEEDPDDDIREESESTGS